jgi:hypothetical protein
MVPLIFAVCLRIRPAIYGLLLKQVRFGFTMLLIEPWEYGVPTGLSGLIAKTS